MVKAENPFLNLFFEFWTKFGVGIDCFERIPVHHFLHWFGDSSMGVHGAMLLLKSISVSFFLYFLFVSFPLILADVTRVESFHSDSR